MKAFDRSGIAGSFRRRVAAWLALVWAAFGLAGNASAAVFLRLDDIAPSAGALGAQAVIEVLAFNHEVAKQIDPATGQATGKRAHAPLRVVIPHSRPLPQLMNVLVANETIAKGELIFWETVGTTDVKVMEYRLYGIKVESIRPWMPNTRDATARGMGPAVEVAFTYQKIEWFWLNGNLLAADEPATAP